MKIRLLSLILITFFTKTHAQNVGINQPNPAETLDIKGNFNIGSGTIKVNGTAGQVGQTLTNDNSGDLVWQDLIGGFKNFENFSTAVTLAFWTVPVGVTKILVEVVGAGSGGTIEGGGGGGGYFMALLNVTPGTVLGYTVGSGGAGGAGGNSTAGGQSNIIYGSGPSSITLAAQGGTASNFTAATQTFTSQGGQVFYTIPTVFKSFKILFGAAGSVSHSSFQQKSATSFYEIYEGGYGGGPGNCRECTTRGSYVIYDIAGAANYRKQGPESKLVPGAGGGAGISLLSAGGFTGGGTGADGQVTVHY